MKPENNNNDFYWKVLQEKIQEQRIEEVFRALREEGYEPILIKGWAAARYYPDPSSRVSADTDIAVNPADYSGCEALLKRLSIGGIDLHCGLRQLDTVPWNDLFERSRLLELNKSEVRVLCPEDHLRILCVHWLADGGVSKERLWDIYYLVRKHSRDFNWDGCLGIVSETRRQWIICTVGLAVKYLGLVTDHPEINGVSKNLPSWITNTVEKEWKSEVALKPLHHCLGSRRELVEQLRKRFPPNPIQSTIEMEGKFDNGSRLYQQFGSVLLRIKPSIKRVARTFWMEIRAKYDKD